MTKLDDLTADRVELAEYRGQSCFRIAVAWRKLEQKTAHSVAQDVRNHLEILHQRFRALELLEVGDELADFDGIDEVSFFLADASKLLRSPWSATNKTMR